MSFDGAGLAATGEAVFTGAIFTLAIFTLAIFTVTILAAAGFDAAIMVDSSILSSGIGSATIGPDILSTAVVVVRIGFVGVRCGSPGRGAQAGQNGLGLNLALAQGGEIVGNGFFFVEADVAGVGPDEPFVENAAGKLVEVFVFDGAEHAGADFRGGGDGVEREAAMLALFAKFFSEGTHPKLRRARVRPALGRQ